MRVRPANQRTYVRAIAHPACPWRRRCVEVSRDGSATLLDDDGVTATTRGNPTDVALSNHSRYLYARVAALNSIAVFRIESDGSLTPQPSITGTPANLAGLAAFWSQFERGWRAPMEPAVRCGRRWTIARTRSREWGIRNLRAPIIFLYG